MEINIADGQIQGQRSEQQDSRINMQLENGDYQLYVLADGMGGHIGGALASKEVIKGIVNYFEKNRVSSEPTKDLVQALHDSNERLTNILRDKPHMNGMGSTVIAFLHKKQTNQYWFVSVGDSPLYKWNEELGLVRINANHAYYEELLKQVDQGILNQEEADNHEQRHAITSALMGKNIELMDVQSGEFEPKDRLLIASDGVQTLNDAHDSELAQLIKDNFEDLNKTVSEILKVVSEKQHPYQDNTTLIFVKPFKDTELTSETVITEQILDKNTDISLVNSNSPDQKMKTGKRRFLFLLSILIILAFGVGAMYLSPIKEVMTSFYLTNEIEIPAEQSFEVDNMENRLLDMPSSEENNSESSSSETLSTDEKVSLPAPASEIENSEPISDADSISKEITAPVSTE